MKYWILLVVLFANSLAADEPLEIHSDLVEYTGKAIQLTGHATVDHALGKIEANHIVLIPNAADKKMHFAHVKMNENVNIRMRNGGCVTCAQAELDYEKMQAYFLDSSEQKHVVYQEYLGGNENTPAQLFEVKSREMQATLEKDKNASINLQKIHADRDVQINYNNEYFARADHGLYETQEKTPHQADKLTGKILLTADNNQPCRLSSKSGDLINAAKIDIDANRHEMILENPKGIISNKNNNENNSGEINFSCNTLVWNESQDFLSLREQVVVNYVGVGNLSNPREIRIYRHLINGKRQISSIEGEGHSVLNYLSDKSDESYLLETYGKFVLDNKKQQARIDSPHADMNTIPDGQQIHFSGSFGDIYADDVLIIYQEIEKKLKPVKIFLNGHVWMLKQSVADKEDPGKFLQFTLADHVEYNMADKEMLFKADPKNRVLFFDKMNNLQISAPAVSIKRDSNGKDAVNGIGDVRFSFIEKEFEQLEKRFELTSR